MAEEGHPCRVSSTGNPCEFLIEQLRNAIACCFSICTSLCQPREPYQQQGPDGTQSTDQPTEDDPTITTGAAVRRRQRQVPPSPSEGRGGQIN